MNITRELLIDEEIQTSGGYLYQIITEDRFLKESLSRPSYVVIYLRQVGKSCNYTYVTTDSCCFKQSILHKCLKHV